MNDQIKAVWNRAAASHQLGESSWQTQQNFLTRFAELIVQECVEVVKWTPSMASNDEYVKNIREHFGVDK